MKYSWKTLFVAFAVLGLLAAVAVQNAMAAGRRHAAAGIHSLPGHAGKLPGHAGKSNPDKGRFDGRYRDFRWPWYGDRYGRYGRDFYPGVCLSLPSYCPSCYEPSCPSYFPDSPPCFPSCDGPSCGYDDCGVDGCVGSGWDIYGRPYRHHRDHDDHRREKGGEHRLASSIGHGSSGSMPSRIASSGSHGSRR